MDTNELLVDKEKPKEKKQVHIVFVTIDDWNRPIFQRILNGKKVDFYYCCLDKLFSFHDPIEKIKSEIKPEDLVYFGTNYYCDPEGIPLNHKDNEFVINWEK